MKKTIIIIFILLLLLFPSFKADEEEIRIRIIANSNSEFDQNYKLEVKDIIINYLNENIDSSSLVSLENSIINHLENLNLLVGEKNKVVYEPHLFETKSATGNIIKSEEYKTLVVYINDAKGDNWWGTLYPNYLGIDKASDVKYESLIYNLIKGIKNGDS